MAPAIEELFFRGIVLHRIAARRGLVRGILGSCVLFGAIHGPSTPSAFLVGLLLALIYIRTASLAVAAVCHAVYNAVVILRERVGPFGTVSLPLAPHESDLVVTAMAVALPAVALTLRILWPRPGAPLPYQRNATEPPESAAAGGPGATMRSAT